MIKTNVGEAQIEINDQDEMTFKVKLNRNGEISSSGKSILAYTSHGWQALPEGFKVNIGVILPLKKR